MSAPRVGPRMEQAAAYVRMYPGCPMLHAARYCAPHRAALSYGYRTVHRAVHAGMIRAERVGNRYWLWPVDKKG